MTGVTVLLRLAIFAVLNGSALAQSTEAEYTNSALLTRDATSISHVIVARVACTTDADCTNPLLPDCDTGTGLCIAATVGGVTCTTDADCTNPLLPDCDTGTGLCIAATVGGVTCTTDADCTNPLLPTCNTSTGLCIAFLTTSATTSATTSSTTESSTTSTGSSTTSISTTSPVIESRTSTSSTTETDSSTTRESTSSASETDSSTTRLSTSTTQTESVSDLPDTEVTGSSTSSPTKSSIRPSRVSTSSLTDSDIVTPDPSASSDVTTDPTETSSDNSSSGIEEQTTNAASATSTNSVSVDDNPAVVRTFRLLGCLGSGAGFPTFELAGNSEEMDLDLCGDLCEGNNYFGAFDRDCYCGIEYDDSDTSLVANDFCNIECPGNESQSCGGILVPNRRGRLNRRQSVPENILLAVYVAVDLVPGASSSASTPSSEVAIERGTTTVTSTFVTTIVEPAETGVTTVTATVVCYNGQCNVPSGPSFTPVYVFRPYPGEDCFDELVYLPSPCSCLGGVQYVPFYCGASECTGKTVYKPEKTQYVEDGHGYYPTTCTQDVCDSDHTIYVPYEGAKHGGQDGNVGGIEGGDTRESIADGAGSTRPYDGGPDSADHSESRPNSPVTLSQAQKETITNLALVLFSLLFV